MIADSSRHVERYCRFDSLHSSHCLRIQTGCLGECRPSPAIGRLQTQRSTAKTKQPRSTILDLPAHHLAGLKVRLNDRAAGNRNILASDRFKRYWWKLSQAKQPGRPRTGSEIRKLIHTMATDNPTWGAPRIHGELKKLGFTISERTVSRWMPKKTGKPSQTWMTFLRNHVGQMVSIDFFTVPTLQLRVLYVFVVLAHDRRRVLHFNVTEHPTAAWTAQQLVEAFPYDTVPRYLVRDRDGIYGYDYTTRADGIGILQVPISARSPWQNCYAERMIGSIRRECLNHVIVINEWHLRRILKSYFSYYHRASYCP